MKAIILNALDAHSLITGIRTEDLRIWETKEKGRILICSAPKKYKGYVCGHALCTAEIAKITKYPGDATDGGDLYGWHLKKVRLIEPFVQRSRNRISFFEVNDALIHEIKGIGLQDWFVEYYDPLRSW